MILPLLKLSTSEKSHLGMEVLRSHFLQFSDFDDFEGMFVERFLKIKSDENGDFFFQVETVDDSFKPLDISTRNKILENWDLFKKWDWKQDIERFKEEQRDIRDKQNRILKKHFLEEN